jgi:hypothetical protein
MARPTKRTEALVNKLEYAFSIGATVKEACLYADISRETYYKWTEIDKELSDRLEDLRENPIFVARESVFNGMKKDPDLALKFLERKLKKEFSLRQELTGADGKEFIPILGAMTKKELPESDED